MKRLKKIGLVLSVLILIINSFCGTTKAAINCKVNLLTSKNEAKLGEEISVFVQISNIQTNNGVIAVGGIIEYDKNAFELIKVSGDGNWSTPSYNEASGKFTVSRNTGTTKSEVISKITFKIKEKAKRKCNYKTKRP